MSSLLKIRRTKFKYSIFQIIGLIISIVLILNIVYLNRIFRHSAVTHSTSRYSKPNDRDSRLPINTIERSRKALEKLKVLLDKARSPDSQPWIWTPSEQYPSVPYQPTSLENQKVPKTINNGSLYPQSVKNEINRICNRLKSINQISGNIWCKLFSKCYADTITTTTSLLDDNTTYVITGDIDLMWLRDSSAQVHQYITLSDDSEIQRIIEGLIRRQTKFIFANPYGSSFRLTLRPNPPSDDSLQPIHTQKARNVNVAMHNYELDSLCYHLRLSYTWWKKTRRTNAFDQQWLMAVSIIIQLMIVEQHHSEISPYRYTELPNNHQGSSVKYTGMTWSAFRPSDDQTKYGYLIPSNMMASVVLNQINEMIDSIFPEQIELKQQINQLRDDILLGIHLHGIVKHNKYGDIYAYETNGLSQTILLDDANVPSLLSASYFGFKTSYDPDNKLLNSTRNFILSKDNRLYFEGQYARGIGSDHTQANNVWPMSIIMEGLTTGSMDALNSVWQRLEASHAETFAMHESFNVNNPKEFTRNWFAWVNSLFAELVIVRLNELENWLQHHRPSS